MVEKQGRSTTRQHASETFNHGRCSRPEPLFGQGNGQNPRPIESQQVASGNAPLMAEGRPAPTVRLDQNDASAHGRVRRVEPAGTHVGSGNRPARSDAVRSGGPTANTSSRTPFKNEDGTYFVPLTRGMVAIVDACDLDVVSRHKWHAKQGHRTFYAANGFRVTMHRLILKPPHGLQVDHINGDGLDNRRANLRACTQFQNQQNKRSVAGSSSAFKGVSWDKALHRWQARIRPFGRLTNIGLFDSELEAAKAYDAKAKEFYGEFARLNFA